MKWNMYFLDGRPLLALVYALFALNLLLFFVLGIFFDGGAYPWGELRDGRYFIVNNQGTREVSESWFRFTFWQGALAWLSVPAGLSVGSTLDALRARGRGDARLMALNGMMAAITLSILLLLLFDVAQAARVV